MSKHSNNNIGSKKAMKLLISVSAFSIILSYSSLLLPFLNNSLFNVYVSAFCKQSFSSTFEKNCVFLLFNGLLVIIIKNSGLIGKSPELDTNNGIVLKSAPEKASPLALQQVVLEDDDEEDEKKGREQTGKFLITFEREEKEEEEEENVSAKKNELDEQVEVEKRIIIFGD